MSTPSTPFGRFASDRVGRRKRVLFFLRQFCCGGFFFVCCRTVVNVCAVTLRLSLLNWTAHYELAEQPIGSSSNTPSDMKSPNNNNNQQLNVVGLLLFLCVLRDFCYFVGWFESRFKPNSSPPLYRWKTLPRPYTSTRRASTCTVSQTI